VWTCVFSRLCLIRGPPLPRFKKFRDSRENYLKSTALVRGLARAPNTEVGKATLTMAALARIFFTLAILVLSYRPPAGCLKLTSTHSFKTGRFQSYSTTRLLAGKGVEKKVPDVAAPVVAAANDAATSENNDKKKKNKVSSKKKSSTNGDDSTAATAVGVGPLDISLNDKLLFIERLLIPAFDPDNEQTPKERKKWMKKKANKTNWDAGVSAELISIYGTVNSLEEAKEERTKAERLLEKAEEKAERSLEKARENEIRRGKSRIICSSSSFSCLVLSCMISCS
jgi:hypothetical protein